MPLHHIIMVAVGLVALIGVIVSFLGMAGALPGGRAVDGWNSPYLFWLIVSAALFALDVILDGLVFTWEHDPTHLLAPGLAVLCLVVVETWVRRVYGASLLGWWRKLVPGRCFMRRIDSDNRGVDLCDTGKDGVKAPVPGVTTPTQLTPAFLNSAQNEIARIIEAAGSTPSPAPVAAPSKKPWLSKTIMVNALVAALLLAENKLEFLQGLLPASKYQIVAFTLPIVNMLLRVYTTQGLSLKPQQPSTGASE